METGGGGMDMFIWLGIIFCLTQSAMFSGLNLAFFSLSRLQLEVEANRGDKRAAKMLTLRQDSNFLLATILWANVSINVLLTMLSDSAMAGVLAFLFSTFAITFFGEIIPQAYFSRNALKVASTLTPCIRFYQFLLYPVAKLTAVGLDAWLGKEGITYFQERELKGIIKAHVESSEGDIGHVEGIGAMNFLAADDLPVCKVGSPVDEDSVILRSWQDGPITSRAYDAFVAEVNDSNRKWMIIAKDPQHPELVLDADAFSRSVMRESEPVDPLVFCKKPLVVREAGQKLGQMLLNLKHAPNEVTKEIVLVWSQSERRIITGTDVLNLLFKGV